MACVVTNLAASVGGLTWVVMDLSFQGKWSVVGFCSGAVSALVAITPGSGFVPSWAAVVYGVAAGVFCNIGTKFKYIVKIDDYLDIFAIHAIGGFVGVCLTSFPGIFLG